MDRKICMEGVNMKLRKLFALLTALIMLLGMLPTASATLVDCNHDWRWEYTDESAQDCRQYNTLVYHCTICGKVDRTEKEPGPCVESDKWVWDGRAPANCGEYGIKNQLCKYCGQPVNEREEAGPHNWKNEIVRKPACDWDGWKESYCTMCGESKGDGQSIPATGHKPVTRVTEQPTCTEDGLEETSCSACDIGLGSKKLPAKGHKWSDWETTKKRTCTEGGNETRTCSACGAKETRETKARGHNYTDFRLTKEPTCVEYGRKIGTCSRCGATVAYNVKLIDHVFGEWEIIREATPDKPGLREKKCVMCGLPIQEEFRIGEENEATNDVLNAISVEVVSTLPVYPNVGDSFVVELRVTNTGDTLLSYSSTELSHHETDACGAPVANGVNIDMLNPGESFIVPVTVNVTDADQALNVVERAFKVHMNVWANEKVGYMTPANKDTENDVSYPVNVGLIGKASIAMLMQEEATETFDPDGLTVTLSDPDGSHMGYFYPGEEVPFSITVTNNTGVALTDVEITDPIKGSNEDAVVDRIISMQPGESVTVSFNYIATEADAAYGTECFENTAYATGYTADGTAINGTSNTVIVPCVIEHGLTFSKSVANTPANGEFFVPGETIVFEISMIDNTVYPIYCITLTDPMCEDQYIYDAINDMSYLYFGELYREDYAELDHSKSATVTVSYVVTEADAAAGSVTNTAEVWYQTWYGEEFTLSASATAPCGPGELPDDYVPPVDGDIDGDGIPNEEDPDVDGDGIPNGDDPDVDGDGIPNEEDPDVDGDGIPNEEDPDPNGTGTSDGTTPDVGLSSALYITKYVTSTPANGSYYVPGETVSFEVYVKNNGDPLNNLHVSDWMWERTGIFGAINTNEDVTYPFTYTVTELDAIAGSVSNIAFAEAVAANGDPVMEYSNDVTVPCGFPEGENPFGVLTGLEITKEVESLPLNGTYYTEGETVAYKITYTNIGELPLTDVRIYDAMSGMSEIATAETLNPSESRVCWLNHTVTADDVTRGYISNTAIGQFDVNGYISTVSSNTVTVDTDGQENFYYVYPFYPFVPGVDSEYDPGTGWFPSIDSDPEGENHPFGIIDTDALHSGNTCCVRTITGRDNVSVSYETAYCPVHSTIQSSVLMMNQAGTTPEMQMQTAAYAVALWRSEAEKLYLEIYEASDPAARTVVMTEFVRFLTYAANYEAMLKVLYPDQPALVAAKVAAMWENKCIDLCYDAHTPASERHDSLLAVTPAAGAASVSCTCDLTAQEPGKTTSVQSYCAVHSFPFSMTDALLQGNDTAESWVIVRQIWMVELTKGYQQIGLKLGGNSSLATAVYGTLTQWMMAREAELIALYPDNPELVMQMMVKFIMTWVNDLCQMAQ